jgi:hypothetical protein
LKIFCYPPLEMIDSGGYSIIVCNKRNKEYLKDREKCLLHKLFKIYTNNDVNCIND